MHKNTLQHFQRGGDKCPLLPMPADAHVLIREIVCTRHCRLLYVTRPEASTDFGVRRRVEGRVIVSDCSSYQNTMQRPNHLTTPIIVS